MAMGIRIEANIACNLAAARAFVKGAFGAEAYAK
jgi:hypothetical protein